MGEHALVVESHRTRPAADRAVLWLKCPDCDLTVHATIGPAAHADRFIADVTAAHRKQMADADGR